MFEALRWRLTAWYVLAFATVFVVIGLVVFGWVRHRLFADVDNAVRDVSDSARSAVAQRGSAAGSDSVVRDVLARATLSGSADVFVLLLNPDGSIAANPSNVPTAGLPSAAAVERARSKGEDWHALSVDHQPLQLRTVAVYREDGTLIGFVQAGKSVEDTDASLRTLAIVIAGGGVVGLVLATVGGLFVAGVAIRPVRRSYDRQREFVADASHELRTPLAVIRTNAESLAASDRKDEAVDDISAEATYMTRLLDDLLLLARSDHGGIALQRHLIDLAETARDTGRVAGAIAARADLKFTIDVRGPLLVEADAERCREVMLILLDNAAKYTPSGGEVTLHAAPDAGDAVISVVDTGIGISSEHVGRLFDRFFRVDKARSRVVGGAGLGLSIAKEIVDAHGGSIGIELNGHGQVTYRVE